MDHIKVLKRAWYTLWHCRALWVFGIILVLTTYSWESSIWRGNNANRGDGGNVAPFSQEFPGELPGIVKGEIPPELAGVLVAVGVGLACVIVLLIIAAVVARYVSETALIRMVDEHEETGQKLTVRRGFRLGWSRSAGRLFLINLLLSLPLVLAVIVLLLLALAPLLLWTTGDTTAGVVGTIATVGLVFLVILAAIVVGVALSLLKCFAWRACALDGLGVTASIRHGYALVRQNLRDVGLMWLIMAGVSLGWPIILIPVVFLLLAVGAVLGGAMALLVHGLAGLALSGAVPWILAAFVGAPIFILVLVAPLAFLGGLREVFQSSTWTLTYRELRALGNPA